MKSIKKAFTLVELVVVVVILGILSTIGFVSYIGYSNDAKDAVIKWDFSDLQKNLDLYYAKESVYPADDSDTFWATAVTAITAITSVPKNPHTDTAYKYVVPADFKGYVLEATLWNGNVYQLTGTEGVTKITSTGE